MTDPRRRLWLLTAACLLLWVGAAGSALCAFDSGEKATPPAEVPAQSSQPAREREAPAPTVLLWAGDQALLLNPRKGETPEDLSALTADAGAAVTATFSRPPVWVAVQGRAANEAASPLLEVAGADKEYTLTACAAAQGDLAVELTAAYASEAGDDTVTNAFWLCRDAALETPAGTGNDF